MPRTKKLNLGARKMSEKGGYRKRRVKDLTSKVVSNEEDEEELIFEADPVKPVELPKQPPIEVVKHDPKIVEDLVKTEAAKLKEELLNEKAKRKAEKEAAKTLEQAEKDAVKEAKRKAKELADQKYKDETKAYVEQLVTKTILQRDKSILLNKMTHVKNQRSNLNF